MSPVGELRSFQCRGRSVPWAEGPAVMGILNVTPDSFSDGGEFVTEINEGESDRIGESTTVTAQIDHERAVQRAEGMARDGAAIVDVGGQSTRPGFQEISPEVEMARVIPVIARLVGRIDRMISVDTYKPAVARAALAAGAHLINDVHGLQVDPEMAAVVAEFQAGIVIMHQDQGFRNDPADTVDKLKRFFDRSMAIASAAGVPPERMVLDPGIGFHKSHQQNLEIIGRLDELRTIGVPILLGVSRKSTIGKVLDLTADQRLEGTLATTAIAAWHGVEIVRVHDVQANLRAAKMAAALRAAVRRG